MCEQPGYAFFFGIINKGCLFKRGCMMILQKSFIFSLIQTCLERPQPLSVFGTSFSGLVPGIGIQSLCPYSNPFNNFVIRPLLRRNTY